MNMALKRHKGLGCLVKCICILLVAALCLIDVPLSFAAFNSISKTTFSASVTIGGDGGNGGMPVEPDEHLYQTALPYIKYFLDRAHDNDSFKSMTRSFQNYNGEECEASEAMILHGASSYDQAVLGRMSLAGGSTAILDTYVDHFKHISDPNNPVFNCNGNYKDAEDNPILYGPYRIIRISGRDEPSWYNSWDWIVDTGAAAVLAIYALEAYQKAGNDDYKDLAVTMGEYMLRLQDADGAVRYGPRYMYHDSDPVNFYWHIKSTEQNMRALYAFEALYQITAEIKYYQASDAVKSWLKNMYNKDFHLYHSAAEYSNGQWHKSELGTDSEYVATDVMALAPFNLMFDDMYFGSTQEQRALEVDRMFEAIEARTAFLNHENNPILFKFSVSQDTEVDPYGSVEFSSQMAIAYLRVAQAYKDINTVKAQEYLVKYDTLVASLAYYFSIPADDAESKIAPYASYLDGSVAGGLPTGTGYNTYNCGAALASSYYAFARAGYFPYTLGGGSGVPDIDDDPGPAYTPYDYYSYDAHEMGEDGFTAYEKYILSASGAKIFDEGIGLALTASADNYQAPADVEFAVSVNPTAAGNIVKYEWDFDGNGTYDRWQYASKGNSVKYKYTAAGSYNVRARATTKLGQIHTAAKTITILKPASSPTVHIAGDAAGSPVINNFIIPAQKKLDAAISGANTIIRYQWDTTGDGEYDISSTKSAVASKTFNETISRVFAGSFKATDAIGLSDIVYMDINHDATGWNNSPYRPMVYLDSAVVYGIPTEYVPLGGYGIPAGGTNSGYVKKLEWDFYGNGLYAWSNSLIRGNTPADDSWTIPAQPGKKLADVTYRYGVPGIYKARLKAHTEANVSSYKTAIVMIQGDEPAVRARAKVSENGSGLITEIANSKVPIKARFDHSQSTRGDDYKYEWDFDGDKRIDYATTDINAVPAYDYTIPGYHVAMLRVTDAQGRIDVDYIPVFCAYPDTGTYSSAIKMPKGGQTIAGNSVTLVADVFPDDAGVNSVMFQYSADNGSTWANIGAGSAVMSYSRVWDTTAVSDGEYHVRAVVNNISLLDGFKATVLNVDNNTISPDVYENNNGTHIKRQVVGPSQENNILLPDGTHIYIPYDALPDDESLPEVTIEEVIISGIINAIDINITGANTFLKDITISIPYPDENNDGIVDGTNIDENTLIIRWYNEAKGEWEPLYDSVVYPNENFVRAKVNHLSLFGIGGALVFGGLGSALAGSSTTSYCFIATAAYGTPMAGDVMALKAFRDDYLMKTAAGKGFVKSYYRYSPPIAHFISDKPILRKITRFLLRPLVRFAKTRTS
jgi:hypothetical protein